MPFQDNILVSAIMNLNDDSQLRLMIHVLTIILCILFFYSSLNAHNEKDRKTSTYSAEMNSNSMADFDTYSLMQNSPNPFSDSTHITYELPQKSKVLLEVYSDRAEDIITLVDDIQNAGSYSVTFYTEINNMKLPAGVYYYKLKTTDPANKKNEFVDVKRMIIIE